MRLSYLSVQRYHDLEIFLPFRGDKLDMTVKEIIPLGGIRFDHKFHGKLISPSDIFERNCQRYIVNMTTKKVHWRLSGK